MRPVEMTNPGSTMEITTDCDIKFYYNQHMQQNRIQSNPKTGTFVLHLMCPVAQPAFNPLTLHRSRTRAAREIGDLPAKKHAPCQNKHRMAGKRPAGEIEKPHFPSS
jgi:hypothetical protein